MEEVCIQNLPCFGDLITTCKCHSLAGQSGLVGALAKAYIDWSREYGGETEDYLVSLLSNHELG